MAAPPAPDPNTEEGRVELMSKLDPDFHGLLQRKEVTETAQALLSRAGCRSLSRFASVADTRAQLRAFLQNTLQMDPATQAMEIASLVDAWEGSRVRMEVRHRAEAEASSSNLPMALQKVEVQDLRKKFENAHFMLEDKAAPAPSTLELLCDQVENGEFKVMMLVQFLSREDAEVDPIGAVIDKSGTVKVRKGYGETKEPQSSEELRHRLRVLAHAYIMTGMKYPQKQIFQDLDPQDFTQFADYLLGDQVMNLRSEDEHGTVVSTPTLKLVLSYEHQVRKEMVKKMNAGTAIKKALEESRKDVGIKERFLLTPMSLNAVTAMRPRERRSRTPIRMPRFSDADKKGKGGRAKGKGKQGKEGLHKKTPDGREICFKWNSMKERCRHDCGRVHVCMRRRKVAVLYFFSGKSRQSSVKNYLEALNTEALHFEVTEVDIVHGKGHDLSVPSVRDDWLDKIKRGMFEVVLVTPPCSTFTRVRMANLRGPPPIRSRTYPWGFPWLSKQHLHEASLGNDLVIFMVDVYKAAEICVAKGRLPFVFLFSEHPEDLGRVYREEDNAALDPAAIWQLDMVRNLLKLTGLNLFTLAFHQCCFQAGYRKPTRIISNLEDLRSWGHEGWPQFGPEWNYLGPVQECKCRPQQTLARRQHDEGFRTTGTSAYPPLMDKSLAQAIHAAVLHPPPPQVGVQDSNAARINWGGEVVASSGAVGSQRSETHHSLVSSRSEVKTGDGESLIASPVVAEGSSGDEKEEWKECKQRPMLAYYKGRHRTIHDGGGLCSPGRWPIKDRRPVRKGQGVGLVAACRKEFLKWILKQEGKAEKVFQELIGGKLKGSPFGDCLDEAREALDVELEKMGQLPRRRKEDRDSEVNFRRLQAMARVLGDEDCEFLEEMASTGVPLGADETLPRTPKVFEEKIKWPRELVEEEMREIWADNYESAEAGKEDIYRQVDEEVQRGTIKLFTEEEAKAKYGDRLAVAALGAVPKELDSDRVRLIHDGTYSVDVNRRIRVRDRLRFPLIDDAAAVMLEAEKMSRELGTEERCSVVYDVKRAHKLVPVAEKDWGLQSFRLPGDRKGDGVYMHTRGTFGVASAAYYWQRLAATMIRVAHRLGGHDLGLLHLLFADDGWLLGVGKHCWRPLMFWLFAMELNEFPLSWEKLHGGDCVRWIGYELDIRRFEKGVSDRKVQWVADWIDRRLQEGGLLGRDLKSALGRLVFVAGALQHVRPFLGPIFAWSAVLKGGIYAKMPDAVALLLKFVRKQIVTEPMSKVREVEPDPIDAFRIDAKAEGDEVVVGGWESHDGGRTENARWFSIRLNRKNAPWVFLKGEPYRNIAALELTAVLVAVIMFGDEAKKRCGRACMRLTALTDNSSISYVLKKYLSCKFPLSVVLLELSCQLKRIGMELDLHWVPRGQNVPADSLTNGRFEGFSKEKRLDMDFEKLEFIVLHEFINKAGELDEEIKLIKTSREGKQDKTGGKRKRGETKWKDPWRVGRSALPKGQLQEILQLRPDGEQTVSDVPLSQRAIFKDDSPASSPAARPHSAERWKVTRAFPTGSPERKCSEAKVALLELCGSSIRASGTVEDPASSAWEFQQPWHLHAERPRGKDPEKFLEKGGKQ
eukprot:s207_g5.t1